MANHYRVAYRWIGDEPDQRTRYLAADFLSAVEAKRAARKWVEEVGQEPGAGWIEARVVGPPDQPPRAWVRSKGCPCGLGIRVVAPSPSADATGELGLAVADRSQEAAEAAGGDPPVPPGSGGPVSGSRPASWPGRGEPTGPDAEDPPHITISPAACGCDPDCRCLGCPVCEARRPEFKEPDGMRDDLREGEK